MEHAGGGALDRTPGRGVMPENGSQQPFSTEVHSVRAHMPARACARGCCVGRFKERCGNGRRGAE